MYLIFLVFFFGSIIGPKKGEGRRKATRNLVAHFVIIWDVTWQADSVNIDLGITREEVRQQMTVKYAWVGRGSLYQFEMHRLNFPTCGQGWSEDVVKVKPPDTFGLHWRV